MNGTNIHTGAFKRQLAFISIELGEFPHEYNEDYIKIGDVFVEQSEKDLTKLKVDFELLEFDLLTKMEALMLIRWYFRQFGSSWEI